MIFTELALSGAYTIDLERLEDDRGFFARTWCAEEFRAHGLPDRMEQGSMSHSRARGTLRGMHWQEPPHAEDKLVHCGQGSIFDVIIDLRPNSSSYLEHFSIELNARDKRRLFVPKGFAHGFQTLEADTEVHYQMTVAHAPDFAHGLRWDDPLFEIQWPLANPVLRPRDAHYSDYRPLA